MPASPEAIAALDNLSTMINRLREESDKHIMHDSPDDDIETWIARIEHIAYLLKGQLIAFGYAVEARRAFANELDEAEMNRLVGMLEFSGAMIPGYLKMSCDGLRTAITNTP